MSGQRVIKLLGFYVLQADEIGVKLNMGKFAGAVGPGPGWASPLLQQVLKTTSSLQTIDLPDQKIVLSGNIAITISGNLNFRVADPQKAILTVENYRYTVQQFALTTISDVLSSKSIEEVRTEKMAIAQEIEDIVAETSAGWGLSDVDIRLTDARLEESLMRAMMRETEAQKEARASEIRAEADKSVAMSYAEAANTLNRSPGALTLRVLQSLTDLSNEKSTIVVPVPWDLLGGIKEPKDTTAAVPEPREAASAQPVDDPSKTVPEPRVAVSSQPVDDPSKTVPVATAATVAADEFPYCKLEYQSHRTLAVCPQCETKYNVTEIQGDMRYDKRADVPGLQIQCKRCPTVFTLPGSE
jgi:hypothetical protein